MVNRELVNYIRKTKNKGFSIGHIRSELEKAGHSIHHIEEAVTEVIKDKNKFKAEHVRVLLIALIGISVLLSLGMVYKLISSVSSFDINQGVAGAAVKENINCDDLEDKSQDWCYFNLAKNNQAKKHCKKITNVEIKDFCNSVASGEEIDCSKLLSENVVAECT